jgi:hypothetical protein
MATSTLGWSESSPTKFIDTFQRSISAVNKEDQIILPGEHYLPTYSAIGIGLLVSGAVSNHLICIQSDGTLYTRIYYIEVQQAGLAGAANTAEFRLLRTTTAAPTGGTTISARAYDSNDATPYAGTCMTLPTAKGTETDQLDQGRIGLVAAQPIDNRNRYEWSATDQGKVIIIPPGVTNGIALKINTTVATATVDVVVVFKTSTYL